MNKYLLRCRFDFANRPTWFSQWDKSGDMPCDKACFQNKEGLIRAAIEGKDRDTRQTVVLAECDGHDFNNFEWAATAPMAGMAVKGSQQLVTTNVGLILVTRSERVIIGMDGSCKIETRSEEDKKFHFAGFGK